MAKSKKGDKKGSKKAPLTPLARALGLFMEGDYVQAKAQLDDEVLSKPDLPEAETTMAKAIRAGMGFDKSTLLVGLGCIAFMVLVLLVTGLKQP